MKKLAALFLFGFPSLLFAADAMLLSGPAITPVEAVEKAATNAGGISGVFEMVVQSTGVEGETVMLYSESDSRDPRCLAIALFPSALKEMFKESGLEPVVDLKGKKIRVRGGTDVTKRGNANDPKDKSETSYRRTFVPVFHSKNLAVVR